MSNGKHHRDWRLSPLGNAAEVTMGSSPPGESYNAEGKGVPLINGPVEFSEGDFGLTIRGKYTTEPTRMCRTNDLLLCVRGSTTGRTNIAGFDACIGRGVASIRAKEDQRFLNHFIRTQRQRIFDLGNGSTFPSITQDQLVSVQVPLPPLPEQKRIADILDKADAIRRKRFETVQLSEKLKESLFLEIFGDPRWPEKPWTEASLAEVTDLDAPMVDPREEEYQDLVHIGPDRIEKETGKLLPAQTAAEERLISGKFLFDDRYLLYSKIRPYLRKVAMPDFRGLCSADVYPVRPKAGKATREYLFSLLISEAFLAYTQSLPSRASIPKLNRDEFGKYRFPLPPLNLQEKYTSIVKQQAGCTKRLSQAADESESLFNSLVQRAFRGEL